MKKTIITTICITVGIIILISGAIFIVKKSKKRLVCLSDIGNIAIMYNKETITGYETYKMNYNFDEQKKIADEVGIEEYLTEFEKWFTTNSNGTCTRK